VLPNCVTRENFAEAIAKANTRPGCQGASQNITSHDMTMDISRSRPNVHTSAHQVVELVDSSANQHLERNCDRITFNICFEMAVVPGS